MEQSKIPLFERFDIISTIMPYYAHTHKAFLLMSQLYSASRKKLDEYYDEFISCMSEYCMSLAVNFKSETKTWNLPNDLFEVSISMIDTSLIDNFVSYFTKSIYHNSCYFHSHSMHSQIKIKNPICVNLFCTEGLYPHVDTLKSIQIKYKDECKGFISEYQSISLDTKSKYIIKLANINLNNKDF